MVIGLNPSFCKTNIIIFYFKSRDSTFGPVGRAANALE